MRYATVCSGVEASSLALDALGWTPVFFSEIEPFPSAVLAERWPAVPNLGDMNNWKEWPHVEKLDLVCGGTPCQSFSIAGLRAGLDDPRGNLALVYLAIVDRYRPRWVVWENVPGVLSSGGGRDFAVFIGALAELGYSAAWRVLDAQYFGVPQRRARVFVVGHLGADWRPPFAVLFEPEGLRGDTPARGGAGQGATSAPGGRAKGSHWDGGAHPCLNQSSNTGGVGMSDQELFSQRGAYLVMAHGQGGAEIADNQCPTLTCNHEAPICVHGSQDPIVSVERAHPVGAQHNGASNVIAIRTAQTGANGHGVSVECAHTLDGAQGQAVAFRACGQDGFTPAEVAPPVCATDGGGAAAPTVVRRLTPMECERLQGMPDNHTRIPWRGRPAEHCPDGPRYKAIGNSMAVPVMRWLGERIQMWDELEIRA